MSPVSDLTNDEEFFSILSCSVISLPISYLGLPLGAQSNSKAIWNPVLEMISKRLSIWKGRYLSKGGKLILFKSVLSSLPIYFLSLFKVPVSIANQIERIQRSFLWNSDCRQKKIHWVKWKDVCRSMCKGGLGIRSAQDYNRALLNKWLWRFGVESQAIWRRVIAAKYGEEQNGWISRTPTGLNRSGIWRGIAEGIGLFSRFIRFKVNNEEQVSFWYDSYCSTLPLCSFFPSCYKLANVKRGTIRNHMIRSRVWCSWNIHPRRNPND